MKINLENQYLAHIITLVCKLKIQLNFFHISCHPLSTAENSRWKWKSNKRAEIWCTYHLKGVYKTSSSSFSVSGVISYYQLSIAENYINLKSWILAHNTFGVKIEWKFLVNQREEVNTHSVKPVLAELVKNTQLIWVEISLARSGWFFFVTAVISCQQLITAVKSWWEPDCAQLSSTQLSWVFWPSSAKTGLNK